MTASYNGHERDNTTPTYADTAHALLLMKICPCENRRVIGRRPQFTGHSADI
jgi:hypothetical protein